ncbi:MAG: hypothetical protein JWO31_2158 [Phycisphaerales bacterium]|nr:hypothetical protein [Phycisphaerales bacterium]
MLSGRMAGESEVVSSFTLTPTLSRRERGPDAATSRQPTASTKTGRAGHFDPPGPFVSSGLERRVRLAHAVCAFRFFHAVTASAPAIVVSPAQAAGGSGTAVGPPAPEKLAWATKSL